MPRRHLEDGLLHNFHNIPSLHPSNTEEAGDHPFNVTIYHVSGNWREPTTICLCSSSKNEDNPALDAKRKGSSNRIRNIGIGHSNNRRL